MGPKKKDDVGLDLNMYLLYILKSSIHMNTIPMKTTIQILTLIALSLAAGPIAIADSEASKTVDPKSIYHRLGGQPAIDAAVDLFYTKVLADKRVNHFFEDVNMKRQIRRQKAFLAAAFGGPIPYEGRSLRKAHADLDLKESDFNAIAGHLQATLKELKIDEALIGEVMKVAASTKDAVLNRPTPKE